MTITIYEGSDSDNANAISVMNCKDNDSDIHAASVDGERWQCTWWP